MQRKRFKRSINHLGSKRKSNRPTFNHNLINEIIIDFRAVQVREKIKGLNSKLAQLKVIFAKKEKQHKQSYEPFMKMNQFFYEQIIEHMKKRIQESNLNLDLESGTINNTKKIFNPTNVDSQLLSLKNKTDLILLNLKNLNQPQPQKQQQQQNPKTDQKNQETELFHPNQNQQKFQIYPNNFLEEKTKLKIQYLTSLSKLQLSKIQNHQLKKDNHYLRSRLEIETKSLKEIQDKIKKQQLNIVETTTDLKKQDQNSLETNPKETKDENEQIKILLEKTSQIKEFIEQRKEISVSHSQDLRDLINVNSKLRFKIQNMIKTITNLPEERVVNTPLFIEYMFKLIISNSESQDYDEILNHLKQLSVDMNKYSETNLIPLKQRSTKEKSLLTKYNSFLKERIRKENKKIHKLQQKCTQSTELSQYKKRSKKFNILVQTIFNEFKENQFYNKQLKIQFLEYQSFVKKRRSIRIKNLRELTKILPTMNLIYPQTENYSKNNTNEKEEVDDNNNYEKIEIENGKEKEKKKTDPNNYLNLIENSQPSAIDKATLLIDQIENKMQRLEIMQNKREKQDQEIKEYFEKIENIFPQIENENQENLKSIKILSDKMDQFIKTVSEVEKERELRDILKREKELLNDSFKEYSNYFETIKESTRLAQKKHDLLERLNQNLQKECIITRESLKFAKNYYNRDYRIFIGTQNRLNQIREAYHELKKRLKENLQIQEFENIKFLKNDEKYSIINDSVTRTLRKMGSERIFSHKKQRQIQLREYKKLVNCSVCNIRPKEVVLTTCFHSFCRECTEERIRQGLPCFSCATNFSKNHVKTIYLK
ncbi:e3 ubiquitin-protein ligase bre1 [Anaeramoeba flamelloides]|uniref:E3 ubiquitin protein ligase n=1 Tax=Anaeramoeba flamelloides TaxID=1746091 RepID=A0ABQ8XTA4_9EUKA|nr:e3 ubiquitin-protein ligase bre1 [Anaeramoeba flamelloides]